MAKLPRTMFALPVKWTGGPRNATVADNHGTRSVAVIPTGTFWTRTFLAPNSGGTSEALPRDLIRYVQTQLNAATGGANPWTVAMLNTGFIRISYAGASASTITWGAAAAVGLALGFSGNISVAGGGSQTATMLPAWVWFPYNLEGDPGDQPSPALAVGATLANGQEAVWDEGLQLIGRTARARFCPIDEAKRAALGWSATPYWPPESEFSRKTTPTLVPESCPSAWTVHEFLSCAPGRRLAFTLYDLQQLIAGATTRHRIGAITLESLSQPQNRAQLTVASWLSYVDVPSFKINTTTTETR